MCKERPQEDEANTLMNNYEERPPEQVDGELPNNDVIPIIDYELESLRQVPKLAPTSVGITENSPFATSERLNKDTLNSYNDDWHFKKSPYQEHRDSAVFKRKEVLFFSQGFGVEDITDICFYRDQIEHNNFSFTVDELKRYAGMHNTQGLSFNQVTEQEGVTKYHFNSMNGNIEATVDEITQSLELDVSAKYTSSDPKSFYYIDESAAQALGIEHSGFEGVDKKNV